MLPLSFVLLLLDEQVLVIVIIHVIIVQHLLLHRELIQIIQTPKLEWKTMNR
jgi:hypothetical protein